MNFFKKLLGLKDEVVDMSSFINGTVRNAPLVRNLPVVGSQNGNYRPIPKFPNYTGAPAPTSMPQRYEIVGDSRGNRTSLDDILEQAGRNATPSYAQPFRGVDRINTRFTPKEYAPTSIEELRRRLMR